MMDLTNIVFLQETDVLQIHKDVIDNSPYNESYDLAPDTSLESVLHRIYNHITYNPPDDLLDIASLYGIALCKGHVFAAGNKRTAMVSMGTFLLLNNIKLLASNEEIEQVMVDIAENKIDHDKFRNWLVNKTTR